MLSHRDSDHTGGAPAVLAMQTKATLLSSIEGDHALQSLRAATRCVAGQHWQWDGVEFEVLHRQAQEARLIADHRFKVDVLVVPHHGSKSPSSAAFLDAVQPRIALVQAGYRNRFVHPAQSVLVRYRERLIRLFDSPHCGAMTWHSAQPQEVKSQREQDLRYWRHHLSG